jgi:hypothetical protein
MGWKTLTISITGLFGVRLGRLVVDRHELDAQLLADQRAEHLGRPSFGARQDCAERLALCRVGALVDVDGDAPVAFAHHLRCVGDEDEVEAVERDAVP